MSEPREPPGSAASSPGAAPPAAAAPAGERVPSPAREYRRQREQVRGPYRLTIGSLVVFALFNFVLFYGPYIAAGGPEGPPESGPTAAPGVSSTSIDLGTPVVGNATCGGNTTFPIETVPWVGSSPPVSTREVYLEVQELVDGDIVGGPSPPPSVTVASLCAAGPPTATATWYVVLQNPSGGNVGYFSYSSGWVVLGHPGADYRISNGSALILLSVPPLAGLSFGLCIFGDLASAPVQACDQL